MQGGVGPCKIELRNAAGDVVEDFFVFTMLDEDQIRVDFIPQLDCPDKVLDNGDIKRFLRGYRVYIEVSFTFDDYDTNISDNGRSCQEFLVDLHIHLGVIRIQPHTDESFTYDVLLDTPFKHQYAYNRWVGYTGSLAFKGKETLDTIPIAP